jgi:hypothetical protein
MQNLVGLRAKHVEAQAHLRHVHLVARQVWRQDVGDVKDEGVIVDIVEVEGDAVPTAFLAAPHQVGRHEPLHVHVNIATVYCRLQYARTRRSKAQGAARCS